MTFPNLNIEQEKTQIFRDLRKKNTLCEISWVQFFIVCTTMYFGKYYFHVAIYIDLLPSKNLNFFFHREQHLIQVQKHDHTKIGLTSVRVEKN